MTKRRKFTNHVSAREVRSDRRITNRIAINDPGSLRRWSNHPPHQFGLPEPTVVGLAGRRRFGLDRFYVA